MNKEDIVILNEHKDLTHFILIKHFFLQSQGIILLTTTELGQVSVIKRKNTKS